jgi:DNA topoisomerase-1
VPKLQYQELEDKDKIIQRIERGRRSKWWRRLGTPRSGFRYVDAAGRRVTDQVSLERIKALVIPPAWQLVRISPAGSSRVQAVGVDTTGRVQYLYHPQFAARQQKKKFEKIERFGTFLPQLRSATNQHLALDGFPREKVLALMIRLINQLYIRMGGEKSASTYKTYGITTLQNRHLEIKRGGKLIFEFVGKSSIKHRKVLVDEELAAIMKQLKDLGTSRKLFHYHDADGKPRPVKPGELNEYIKTVTHPDFSAKDFRTWGATLLAAVELAEIGCCSSEAEIKGNIVKAVKRVAEQLGNTPAVCRGSYIHPLVLKAYEKGVILEHFQPKKARRTKRNEEDYLPEEYSLLRLLESFRGGR